MTEKVRGREVPNNHTDNDDSSKEPTCNPQVMEILTKIFKRTETKINRERILWLGRSLVENKLLNIKDPQDTWVKNWNGQMTTRLLLHWLKTYAEKSFSTREVYMRWSLEKWDEQVYLDIHREEIKYVLRELNKEKNPYQQTDWFVDNKMIVKNGADMLKILSFAFGDETKIMHEIRQEITKHKLRYTDIADKSTCLWIDDILNQQNIQIWKPWNPFIFYICANAFKCTVCVVVNAREEYRIHGHKLESETEISIVHFGQTALSKFVYLSLNRKKFDALNVCTLSCVCLKCAMLEQKLHEKVTEHHKVQNERDKLQNDLIEKGEALKDMQTCFRNVKNIYETLSKEMANMSTKMESFEIDANGKNKLPVPADDNKEINPQSMTNVDYNLSEDDNLHMQSAVPHIPRREIKDANPRLQYRKLSQSGLSTPGLRTRAVSKESQKKKKNILRELSKKEHESMPVDGRESYDFSKASDSLTEVEIN